MEKLTKEQRQLIIDSFQVEVPIVFTPILMEGLKEGGVLMRFSDTTIDINNEKDQRVGSFGMAIGGIPFFDIQSATFTASPKDIKEEWMEIYYRYIDRINELKELGEVAYYNKYFT